MLRKAAFVLMVMGVAASFAAENLLVLKIGPTWPSELWNTKKRTAWDASVQFGWIFDRKLAFGGGVDFLWNVNKTTVPYKGSANTDSVVNAQTSFMFPVSGFLAITPLPDLRVHPCASVQLGLNTLHYSNSSDNLSDALLQQAGWYMGFYCKIAADAILNLGENSGLFAGVEYQWANAKKIGTKSNSFQTHRDMGAFGLRMGFRVLY